MVAGGLRSTSHVMTWWDPLGMLVALAATIALSVYFVWVQKSEGVLGNDQILYINYLAVFSFAPALSAVLEEGDWGAVLHFGPVAWLMLLYVSAGVSLCPPELLFSCVAVQMLRKQSPSLKASTAFQSDTV